MCYYYCTYHYYNVDVVLSSVIDLLRTCSAHVSLNEEIKCTTKGTIRPRLRAPISRSLVWLPWYCAILWGILARCYGNQMHCQRYELCVGKCTVKGTTKNCLTFQIPILLSGELARWQAEVTGLVLGSFFFQRTILSIPTSIPLFHTNTLRCNRTLCLLQ